MSQFYINSFSSGNADTYSIRVGSSRHDSGGVVYNVTKIIRHPKHDEQTFDFDVALVRVNTPIKFTVCNSKSVKIEEKGIETPPGKMVQVTGWGAEQVSIKSLNNGYLNNNMIIHDHSMPRSSGNFQIKNQIKSSQIFT